MPHSSRALLDEIKTIIQEGETMDIKTRDRLLLSAIIDIYDQLEKMQPAMTFYRVGLFFATILGASATALIWAILTNQVSLTFNP